MSNPNHPKGIQTKLYDVIVEELYKDSIGALVARRMAIILPSLPDPVLPDFSVLNESFKGFQKYGVFTIIRTWAHGWTTSTRMDEPFRRDCIFGCTAKDCSSCSSSSSSSDSSSSSSDDESEDPATNSSEGLGRTPPPHKGLIISTDAELGRTPSSEPNPRDDLAHYLRCKRLWSTIDKCLVKTSFRYGQRMAAKDLLTRACLQQISKENVVPLVTACLAYHVCKNDHANELKSI